MSGTFAFVFNPKAGKKKNFELNLWLEKIIPKTISYNILEWKSPDDFNEIENQLQENNYDVVVACGGDGTVNRVAKTILNTERSLGIIPLGSGNGLARSLNIPILPEKAIEILLSGKQKRIDTASINGHSFFCTAGVGFDAHVGELFASSTTRGFWSYARISASELLRYSPLQYIIDVDGKTMETEAFLITACNAGQWGNNIYISPEAKMNDGLLHLSVVKPFPILSVAALGLRLLQKKIHQSNYVETLTGKKIVITRSTSGPIHFDGEPRRANHKIEIEIIPDSLTIIC